MHQNNYLYSQVLSDSVAKAMQATQGQESEETLRFITMFDQFFDCFNVRSYDEGKRQRKPFKQPYRSGSDFRLQVCILYYYQHACIHYKSFVYICANALPSGLLKNFCPTSMNGNTVCIQEVSSAVQPRTKCCYHLLHS